MNRRNFNQQLGRRSIGGTWQKSLSSKDRPPGYTPTYLVVVGFEIIFRRPGQQARRANREQARAHVREDIHLDIGPLIRATTQGASDLWYTCRLYGSGLPDVKCRLDWSLRT